MRNRRDAFSGLLHLKDQTPVSDSQVAWAIPGGFFLSSRELEYLRVSLNSPNDTVAIGVLGLTSEKALSNYRTRAVDDGLLWQRRIDDLSSEIEESIESAGYYINANNLKPETLFGVTIMWTLMDRSSDDAVLLFEGIMQKFMKEDRRGLLRDAVDNYREAILSRRLIDRPDVSDRVLKQISYTLRDHSDISYSCGLDKRSESFKSDLELAIIARGLVFETLIKQLR